MSEPTGDILEDERKRRKDIEKRLQDRIDELERVLKAQAIVSTQTVRNLSNLSKKVSSVQKDTELRPQEAVELQERPQEREGQPKKSQNVWTLEGAHQKEEPHPSAPPVVLVYGARLLLIISGVRISNLYKSTLWWPYLGAPDTPSLLKRPNPLRNG